MLIIDKFINNKDLTEIAKVIFGDMVKGVVDIEKEIIAIDAELHSDLEAFLLEKNSKQENLWGINLYPEIEGDDFLEFDSMINIRPRQHNMSRNVENSEIRKQITRLVLDKIKG